MAKKIRLKKIEVCDNWQLTSQNGYECGGYKQEDAPLVEWDVNPPTIVFEYIKGKGMPSQQTSRLTFPELDLWNDAPYKKFVYKTRVTYNLGASNWLNVSTKEKIFRDGGNSGKINPRQADVLLDVTGLAGLSAGRYSASIIYEAYGIDDRGGEHYIEPSSVSVTVKLEVKQGQASPSDLVTDKTDLVLTYNKATKTLSGDTRLEVHTTEPITFNITPDWESFYPFSLDILKETDKSVIQISKSAYSDTTPVDSTYEFHAEIKAGGKKKTIIILFKTISGEVVKDFDFSPRIFEDTLIKGVDSAKTFTADIVNPNNLEISVSLKPSFIETAVIEGGKLKITTVKPESLAVGAYSGEILLSAGTIEKSFSVRLKIAESLKSDFRGEAYYFALDKNKIKMSQNNPFSSYVKMKLEMFFKGYQQEYQEVQEYEYLYFKNEVEIFPGEEIQDFFARCRELYPLNDVGYQYSFALVNITITEHNADDEQLSEYQIKNVFFVPGRRPRCFPLFTNHPMRRTYPESVIRISADAISEKAEFVPLMNIYQGGKPAFEKKNEVRSHNFTRKLFAGKENEIITAGDIKYIPFPEVENPIHIFFETENLVFEWFSAHDKYRMISEFEHYFDAENKLKYGSKRKKSLTINTGWILREEIALIDDLLGSNLCFIMIGNLRLKAVAVGKKNEMYDTSEHLYHMDLEFNVIETM